MELRPDYPLRTERLKLRPLADSDTEDLFAYRGLDEVARYVPFEPMDRAVIAAKLAAGWARRAIKAEGDALTLGLELAAEGTLIGDVVLFFESALHRRGQIGWVLHPAYSGHGYATEGAREMLRLAFDQLGLHRVTARIDARNGPSLRLAERLGMRREAYLVENEWFKGAWSDEVNVAILHREWSGQRAGVATPRSCGLDQS